MSRWIDTRNNTLATDRGECPSHGKRNSGVLFFIELGTRRVDLAGSTSRPSGTWVAQQARNPAIERADHPESLRFLVHDCDAKFSAAFDEVFRTEGWR
jgi:putative transposase